MSTFGRAAPIGDARLASDLAGRFLVVEDSASDQLLLRESLRALGVSSTDVVCVGSLMRAREVLLEGGVCFLLLGLDLPDATGLEGVSVMAVAAPDIPIVVVAGRPADSLIYSAMAEGADEYLCKADLDPGHLSDLLLRAVQRRRASKRRGRVGLVASSVLDQIDSATATLDGGGRIVSVNRAWVDAAVVGGATSVGTGVGVNYLTVCDQAAGVYCDEADEAAAGIRAVLRGDVDRFAMDYPCPALGMERWFTLRVTPLGVSGGGAVVTHLDITDLKVAEHRLRLGGSPVHAGLGESSSIFAVIGADGTVAHVSEATSQLLGLSDDQVVGASAFARIDPADQDRAAQIFSRVAATAGAEEQTLVRTVDGEGRRRHLDLTVINLLDDPTVRGIVITGSDVTQGRLAQIVRKLETDLLRSLPAAVMVTDDLGVVVYWNDQAADMYGISATEAIGQPAALLSIDPTDSGTADAIKAGVLATGRWEGEYEVRRSDGATISIRATLSRIVDEAIDFHGIVGAAVDISDRRQLEEEIAFQALHDPLTGLPNRRRLIDHVDNALARGEQSGRHTAVLFIDLDDFRLVNERLGPQTGDDLLRAVGGLITETLSSGDLVARLGGDKFVVCCNEISGPAEVFALTDRIVEGLRSLHRFGPDIGSVSASVGVAVSVPGSRAERLVRNADIAMCTAKQAGKGRVELFDDKRNETIQRRQEEATELARAIEVGEIVAYYQPEYTLDTGALTGFEALARWIHPERGMIPPDEFIALAEETGLIGLVGQIMLRSACNAANAWAGVSPDDPPSVAVNVSVHQLADPAFPDQVAAAINGADIPPGRVCLEVTDSALGDAETAAAALRQLKAIGVEIAIDDFGTGYSSLSRLRQFPIDFLKIDRSFVAGTAESGDDAAIVGAVLGLADSLGLRTIAEGIETNTQLEVLAAAGCDVGQGYLWSRPVPADEAFALVAASVAQAQVQRAGPELPAATKRRPRSSSDREQEAVTPGRARSPREKRPRMAKWRLRVVAAAVVIAVTTALTFAQARTDAKERSQLVAQFAQRAPGAATFMGAYVSDVFVREQRAATARLTAPTVAAEELAKFNNEFGFLSSLVLDRNGDLLAVIPDAPKMVGQNVSSKFAHLRSAVDGTPAVSGVVTSVATGLAVVGFAVPYTAPDGRRVVTGGFDLRASPIGKYLDHILPTGQGSAALIDTAGKLIVGSAAYTTVDPALVKAISVRPQGTYRKASGGRAHFATAPVAGTPWRVLLTSSSKTLFAPPRGDGATNPWYLIIFVSLCEGAVAAGLVRSQEARRDLEVSAGRDALTGLLNRGEIEDRLDQLIRAAWRHGEPLSALMVDVDHFKEINDANGHAGGDSALRTVAQRIGAAVRAEDVPGRWGGDEFVILLPHTDRAEAALVAERIRRAVNADVVQVGNQSKAITLSIGTATTVDEDARTLVSHADGALYRAKAAGRDRTVSAVGAEVPAPANEQ
ncbi:MAG: hypothetical protein NVS3B21_06960 [Acidimicrobiales bacterium]